MEVLIGTDYLVAGLQACLKFLIKFKICIPFNSAILLLGLYPTHLPTIFIAAKYEKCKCLSIA